MQPWNGIVLSLWWGMGLWLRSSIVFYYFGRNTISLSTFCTLQNVARDDLLSSFWVWAWNFNGWSPSSRAGRRGSPILIYVEFLYDAERGTTWRYLRRGVWVWSFDPMDLFLCGKSHRPIFPSDILPCITARSALSFYPFTHVHSPMADCGYYAP